MILSLFVCFFLVKITVYVQNVLGKLLFRFVYIHLVITGILSLRTMFILVSLKNFFHNVDFLYIYIYFLHFCAIKIWEGRVGRAGVWWMGPGLV